MAAMADLPRLVESAVQGAAHAGCAIAADSAQLAYATLVRAMHSGGAVIEARTAPGDRVVVQLPNSVELIAVNLAVMAAGRVAVALSADAGVERTRMALEATAPSLLVAPRAPEPCACAVVRPLLDGAGALRFEPVAPVPLPSAGAGAAAPAPADLAADAAMILFSSGSTGRPKGVVLRGAGLGWTAQTLAELFGFDASHHELILCPLVHSGAWQRAAATLAAGGCVHVADGATSIASLFEEVAAHGITGFYTPPPLIRYLLKMEADRARRAFATVRTIEIGSAPLSGAELRALLELLPDVRVFVHYGLTECSRAALLDARAHADKLDTVGRAVPGGELAVFDAGGNRAAAGERERSGRAARSSPPATGTIPRRRPSAFPAAGSRPATRAASTPTAS
jgi:long-chain acyl-CoA synthetase